MHRSRFSGLLACVLGVVVGLTLIPANARSQVWFQEWVLDHVSSQAREVAVDQAGDVLALGMSFGGRAFENTDVHLRKYDAEGNELWNSKIDSSFIELSGGVSVDSESSVLVSGSRQVSSNLKAFLRKYDASGNLLWDREFGSSGYPKFPSVAVGPDDAVYWIGSSAGQGAVWKFDSSGNEIWTAQFAGPSGFSVDPSAGVVDPDGNLYVAGNFLGVSGETEGFLVRVTSDGGLDWTRELTEGSAFVADAAVAPDGNIRVTGRRSHPLDVFLDSQALEIGFVRTYSPQGDVVSHVNVHGLVPPTAMALDEAGSTYLLGGDDQTVLMKLDSAGKIDWEEVIDLDGPETPLALAVDPAGGILVTGGLNRRGFVMKIDQSPSCRGTSNPDASEDGALSRPIHLRVEPEIDGLPPIFNKVAPTIHRVNCIVVVKVGL